MYLLPIRCNIVPIVTTYLKGSVMYLPSYQLLVTRMNKNNPIGHLPKLHEKYETGHGDPRTVFDQKSFVQYEEYLYPWHRVYYARGTVGGMKSIMIPNFKLLPTYPKRKNVRGWSGTTEWWSLQGFISSGLIKSWKVNCWTVRLNSRNVSLRFDLIGGKPPSFK